MFGNFLALGQFLETFLSDRHFSIAIAKIQRHPFLPLAIIFLVDVKLSGSFLL